MKNYWSNVGLHLRVSFLASAKVFTNFRYVLISILGTILSSSLVLWSLNLELVRYVLFEAPITFISKLIFFWDTYRDIFTTYESSQALGIVVFSVLFGINLALLVYVLKRQGFKKIPKKSGFGGMILAVVSGGCIACGTSLLAPLLATFGAVSSTFLRELSLYLNWTGSLLMIYSIYKLGLLAGYVSVLERQANKPKDK